MRWVNLVVSLSLLAASYRFTIPSACYFLGFVVLSLRPIHWNGRRPQFRLPFWIALLVVSTSMCTAHIVFQIYLKTTAIDLSTEEPLARILALFDLIQMHTASCGMFHTFPDIFMCIVSGMGIYHSCKQNKQQQGVLLGITDRRGHNDTDDIHESNLDVASTTLPVATKGEHCCGLLSIKMQQSWAALVFATSSLFTIALQPTLLLLPLSLFLLVGMFFNATRKMGPLYMLWKTKTLLLTYTFVILFTLYLYQIAGCGVPCCLERCDPIRNATNVVPTPVEAVGLIMFAETIFIAKNYDPLFSFIGLVVVFWSLSMFDHVTNSVIGSDFNSKPVVSNPTPNDLRVSLLDEDALLRTTGNHGTNRMAESVVSDDVNDGVSLRPTEKVPKEQAHMTSPYSVYSNNSFRKAQVTRRSRWMSMFVLVIFIWGLWFPSLLMLLPFTYSVVSFLLSGSTKRTSLLHPKNAAFVFGYLVIFVLAYGIFSTPYIHSSVSLGCPSCTLDMLAHRNPVRSISILGLVWVPQEGRSGASSFYLFLHAVGLAMCSTTLRQATPKRSNVDENNERRDISELDNNYYAMGNDEVAEEAEEAAEEAEEAAEEANNPSPNANDQSPTMLPSNKFDDCVVDGDLSPMLPSTSPSDSFTSPATFKTRCAHCASWLFYIYLLLEAYAFILSLVILYFCGLFWVDFIHATYMIFFILFVVVPNSRKYWRVLVIFTTLVLLTSYLWNILETDSTPKPSNHFSKQIGIDANITSPDVPGQLLFGGTHSFVATVIIFLCVSMQMPLFTVSRQEETRSQLRNARSTLQRKTFAWMQRVTVKASGMYRAYGLYVLCVSLICLGLLKEITITHLSNLVATMVG
jgi:hypothetical protein